MSQAQMAFLRRVGPPQVDFDVQNGEIDFRAFSALLPAKETTGWFRAWTGIESVTGDMFRVFGMDSTGGYAAIWLATDGEPFSEQPIVFVGSEGETVVLARNLSGFLWLVAEGWGSVRGVLRRAWTAGVRSCGDRNAVREGLRAAGP